jgi:hypothetical protein
MLKLVRDGKMLLFATHVSIACTLLEEPEHLRQPEATQLYVDEFITSLHPSGVLVPQLVLALGAEFDRRSDFVRVSVTATSGDRERVRLGSPWCPIGSPHASVACHYFNVWITAEADSGELHRRISESGAYAIPGDYFWSVVSPDTRSVVRRTREARSWPGVWTVSSGQSLCSNFDCRVIFLSGALPVVRAGAKPADGVLQIAAGDTLSLEYVSAAGTGLRYDIRVQ